MQQGPTATALLHDCRGGNAEARERLLTLLYDELTGIARGAMSRERPGHTLQTRALVHEAYLRLIDADVDVTGRAHFLALAARTMRRVLTDHARARLRMKRGGPQVRVSLTEVAGSLTDAKIDYLGLEDALTSLEAQDPRKAQVLELHFYGGLSYDETAAALGVSAATVDRDLRLAKAWLRRELTIARS